MFCSKCGENLAEGTIFCPKCGNKVTGDVSDAMASIAESFKLKTSKHYRHIIMGCAVILCVLFFTLPLVQCSQDSSKTATGIEIATGTGDLFDKNDSGYPLAFLLLIIPVVLLILTFTRKSFTVLRNISIAGVLAKIIFLIYAKSLLNSDEYKGAFELTGFNWLVLVLYIGLCVFTIFCSKASITTNGEGGYAQRNVGNSWICKKCGEKNLITSSSCKSCGGYK
jgi:ribosomal protein L40E